MLRRLAHASVLAAGLTIFLALPAQAISPLGINIRLISAINRGDAAAVAALFTPGGVFQDPPECSPCVGHAAIQRHFAELAAIDLHLNVDNREWTDNTFQADFTATADPWRDLGVNRIKGSYWFHTTGDLIDTLRVTLDTSDPQTARLVAAGAGGGGGQGGRSSGSPDRLPTTGDGSLAGASVASAGQLGLAGLGAFAGFVLVTLIRRRGVV